MNSLATAPDAEPPVPQDLYDGAACALMLTTPDGVIRRVNGTLCRWLGHEASALVDRMRLQDLLTMGSRIFHQTHWAPLLEIQGSVAEVKLEVRRLDGSSIPVVLNAFKRTHAGNAFHEVAFFVATDRHKYERELLLARQRAEALLVRQQQTQQALALVQAERDRQRAVAEDRALFAEQMMGIVSHDLRNPLNIIRMSAHTVGLGELSAHQLRALERLNNSNNRAERLIADLLDFTQVRLGRGLQIAVEPVDLHKLVAETLDDMRSAFPGRAMVHQAVGGGACAANADRLVQVVTNLVANALTHGAPQQPVTVTSEIADDWFELIVRNEGPPVAPALLPVLFEPMVRGVAEGAAQGVGLGLFIVREIARAHGGSACVRSAAADGTTFRIRIPRRPQGPVPPAA